jgi:two-component system LytT family response regulator
MLRTIVIGRTEIEISNISNQIRKHLADKLELIGTSRTIKRGILLIKREVPDLVILDIYKRKPFKFLDTFKSPYNFEVIVTSADKEKVLEAIKLGVFDYMVHPISGKELAITMDRLEKKWKDRPNANQLARKELYIRTHSGFMMENMEDILYFEGALNYSRIFLQTGRDYLICKTLKELEESLGSTFYRIHKSYLVNVSQIKEYSKEGNSFVVLRNGKKLAVSHRRKDKFAREFQLLKQE